MTLDPQDYRLYLETSLQLLYYVGKKENIFPAQTSYKKFLNFHKSEKFDCRQAMYKKPKLLTNYLKEHPDELTAEQVEILTGLKRKIQGDFIIFKYLKKYAVFVHINTNRFYAVQALGDPFDAFFPDIPVIINTTILPFKGKIIYDGFLLGGNVHVGRSITADINEAYKNAKGAKQIITTL